MKSMALALIMLTAASSLQAHQSRHRERGAAQRADSVYMLQTGRSSSAQPGPNRNDCNGGTCSLTGGPSGGPNQS